jgi:hypothetical protein
MCQRMDLDERVNLDRTYLDFSEYNHKFISAYLRYNKIVVLNKNFEEEKTIIFGSKPEGPVSKELMSPSQVFYFKKPYCGTKYFYVPYVGKSGQDKFSFNEIHVYDYNGNPIKKWVSDLNLKHFVVDESQNLIYAITDSEENTYVTFKLN